MHTAIIMDGNGRWATQRSMPRIEGHRKGAESVRRAVEAAPELGITDLTLYAFSSDNWRRPAQEVSGLMWLFACYLRGEVRRCLDGDVRVSVIGRRDRLSTELQSLIQETEETTARCRRLHLRLAVDYSSRDTLLRAARMCAARNAWARTDIAAMLPAPDVDLLIRTAGEQRLSDFLLWECAYAEFVFTDRLWPDFDASDLKAAVRTFASRQRKFGALPAA